MADLIYSRRTDAQELSMDEIARLAPAVFTQGKNPHLTDRYAPVNTLDTIEVLRGYGYVPVQAAQKKPRKNDPAYTQHMVAFAHHYNLLDTDRPEIIAYNSHDGKSSLRLFAGFYRGICSNGLVAGEGFEGRIKHYKASVANLEELFEDVAHTIPKMSERVERMKSVSISQEDAIDFAYNASALRWEMMPEEYKDGELRGTYTDRHTGSTLNRVRRLEDINYDLWTVYNRVQEGLIRGGAQVISFTDRKPYGIRRRARPVASVADSIKINRELWDMASDYMQEAA